jgi:PAS domain S-box-containing protein
MSQSIKDNNDDSDQHKSQKSEQFKQALRLQPEWLGVTLYSIGDAVIASDCQGRITFMNPVAQSLTNWSDAEGVGQLLETVFRIVNEETRKSVENPAFRALREGVVVGLANHTLVIAKDGTERPIDDSAAPIRNDDGEVAGVVLVFRDITERKKAESEAKQALEYAEHIIETLRDPFLVLDPELQVKTVNRAYCQTFQVTSQETENRSIFELGNGQWDIPDLRELLNQVLSPHSPFENFEVQRDFPVIGQKTMLLNARRFVRSDGEPNLILFSMTDITARRQAEAALRDSEARYRRLFESAKDGILILNADDGKIFDANPFMEQLLGYTRDKFLGKELWEIGLFSDIVASRAAFQELQAKGFIRFEDLPLQTKAGKSADVEFVSNVYQENDRRVIQCNVRDISERKRMQDQLQQQALELADSYRRKDEFLAMLSHELRNPLAPILNALHLLRLEGNGNPLQQQARSIIQRQVEHLSRIVDDLLEVSRITTGRVHLRLERIELSNILEQAIESTQPLIERQRHQLSVQLPKQLIWLQADPTRLLQVFVNLLNNAAKYTEQGGSIWLTVEQKGSEVVVRVRDNGRGIPADLLPRIFDLFTQGGRTLDRSEGGLGIGLALAHSIVEMHRGTIEAQSAGPNQGSEFIVRLPIENAPLDVAESSSNVSTQPSGPSPRVLIVEDNVDQLHVLKMLLERTGYTVKIAGDGPSALDAAAEFKPDIVLLDIGLPGMDGYSVARCLRSLLPSDTLLVSMTGYGSYSDRQMSQEAGFDYHLVKPMSFVQLEQLFREFQSQRHQTE